MGNDETRLDKAFAVLRAAVPQSPLSMGEESSLQAQLLSSADVLRTAASLVTTVLLGVAAFASPAFEKQSFGDYVCRHLLPATTATGGPNNIGEGDPRWLLRRCPAVERLQLSSLLFLYRLTDRLLFMWDIATMTAAGTAASEVLRFVMDGYFALVDTAFKVPLSDTLVDLLQQGLAKCESLHLRFMASALRETLFSHLVHGWTGEASQELFAFMLPLLEDEFESAEEVCIPQSIKNSFCGINLCHAAHTFFCVQQIIFECA
jgi:hypothetical protein